MHRTLHTYEYLTRPFEAVRIAFAEEMIDVLQHATEAAATRAVALSTHLHARVAGIEVGTPVTVKIRGFDQSGGDHPSARLRIAWEAERAKALFPAMEADVEAHPITPTETQLALFGTYRPPLGIVGSAADALIGHRLAEAAVHHFLLEVKDRLELMIPQNVQMDG